MKKINELKKTDTEILEEIHKRLSNNNAKTALIVEKLKKETEQEIRKNENL